MNMPRATRKRSNGRTLPKEHTVMSSSDTKHKRAGRPSGSAYVMTADGAVRLRPHNNDVLCGRGGQINNHPGNQNFRKWVHERKNAYNLAVSKVEKARVSREVINLVLAQEPPGRFLTRDTSTPGTSSSTWWVEIDDIKAMAKTSQALREGAPSIRAAHKEELEAAVADRKQRSSSRRGSSRKPAAESRAAAAAAAATAAMPPPPAAPMTMSSEMAVEALRTAAEAAKHGLGNPVDEKGAKRAAPLISSMDTILSHSYERPSKAPRMASDAADRCMARTPSLDTPPLDPVSREEIKTLPPLSSKHSTSDSLRRSHSLSLSEVSAGDICEDFVNPFEDETDFANGRLHNHKQFLPHHPYAARAESNNSFASFGSLQKSSSSDLSKQRGNGNGNQRKNASSRCSMISEMSDLPDPGTQKVETTEDFDEGLKSVWAAVHPDVTMSPGSDHCQTHLYPFKGGGSPLTRRLSPQAKRYISSAAEKLQ